jgi:hypothetical protein
MTIGELIGANHVIVGLRVAGKAQLLQELARRRDHGSRVAVEFRERYRALRCDWRCQEGQPRRCGVRHCSCPLHGIGYHAARDAGHIRAACCSQFHGSNLRSSGDFRPGFIWHLYLFWALSARCCHSIFGAFKCVKPSQLRCC